MSENSRSEGVQPEDVSTKPNLDPDYRPDVWPQSSRYVVNGLLGIILALAGLFTLFTGWSSMGLWSIPFGILLVVAAAYVVSFSFRLK